MNNTFNWNRFCKVVAKDLHGMWPSFGTTMLVLAVLPFALWLLLAVIGHNTTLEPDIRLLLIWSVAVFAAIMAPSRMYRTWNRRNEGIYFAMLPASKLEKFLSALVYCLVVCPLAVFIGSVALDMVLTLLPFGPYREWIWQGNSAFPFLFDFGSLADIDGSEETRELMAYTGNLLSVGMWASYLCSVLMFVFTSTLFKRHKVLQTFLWLYLIEFVLSIVLMMIGFGLASSYNMELIVEWFGSFEPEAIYKGIAWGAIIFDVVLAALFGWLSWRRLNRMAY